MCACFLPRAGQAHAAKDNRVQGFPALWAVQNFPERERNSLHCTALHWKHTRERGTFSDFFSFIMLMSLSSHKLFSLSLSLSVFQFVCAGGGEQISLPTVGQFGAPTSTGSPPERCGSECVDRSIVPLKIAKEKRVAEFARSRLCRVTSDDC